jgi:hypothetical protein
LLLKENLISILSNVVLMRLFAGHFRLHYLLANLVSIRRHLAGQLPVE